MYGGDGVDNMLGGRDKDDLERGKGSDVMRGGTGDNILSSWSRVFISGKCASLNAWCELSGRKLSGRCPRFRVGLLPDPEGKGTGLSWSTWTPSSPHFTL